MIDRLLKRRIFPTLATACLTAAGVTAQVPDAPKPPTVATEKDELRIDTNLIQTGFGVFNKKGEFVSGLKLEDLELRVNGVPVKAAFFDQVSIGSAVSANADTVPITDGPAAIAARSPGRTIVFVVDDLHLSFEGLTRTRDLLLKFVNDPGRAATDRIAIVSSGGKIGFLQQFTTDKAVAAAAAARLVYNRNMSSGDNSAPPMKEYEAKSIERGDRDVTGIFVSETLRLNPGMLPQMAESIVQSRARAVLNRARAVTSTTLSAIEASVRAAELFPDRKFVYFLSEGFLLDQENSDVLTRLNTITDAAARSNTVIYSFDVTGLDASLPDGTLGAGGLGYSIQAGGRFENQDALSYVANNTGGRFIHNTNDLKTSLETALSEAFSYYVIAWEPESDSEVSAKLKKIELTVKGRPELKVLVHRGYLARGKNLAAAAKPEPKAVLKKLNDEPPKPPVSVSPARIPTVLSLSALDLKPDEGTLAASIQIDTEAIEFEKVSGTYKGSVVFSGTILDSNGKTAREFSVPVDLELPPERIGQNRGLGFNYDYNVVLKPGLYQMRLTAKDTKSGRMGNAVQWLEIPDVSALGLALSSIFLGERRLIQTAGTRSFSTLERKLETVFERSSVMRIAVILYDPASGAGDEIEVRSEVLIGGKVLLSGRLDQLTADHDNRASAPYLSEIALSDLPPGKYELRITATNKGTRRTAVQTRSFEIL